ncbi:hypothetical protein MY4824_003828 [Beauveria thailandica]
MLVATSPTIQGLLHGSSLPPRLSPSNCRRDGRDEQDCAAKVYALPDQIQSVIYRGDDAWRIGEHFCAKYKGNHGTRHLRDEAPSPADGVGNAATKRSTANRTKAHDAVLHRLIHAAFPKGNEVRVDDCR